MRLKVLLLTLFSLFGSSAYAQFKASLQGTVLDGNGGVVSGAKVTVSNQDTGVTRNTVASSTGFFRVSELPPGKYTVIVESAGFKKASLDQRRWKAGGPRGCGGGVEGGRGFD